ADVLDIYSGLLRIIFFHKSADASDYFARPVAILDDPLDGAAYAIQVGIFAAKKAQAGLAVGHDRSERLVHLVRDRSAYFSQRRDPAGVSQRGLCGIQRGLRLPALGNV